MTSFSSQEASDLKTKEKAAPAKPRKRIANEAGLQPSHNRASSEGRNYKFYEDIVSFEDEGGEKEEKERDYQIVGDQVMEDKRKKGMVNGTSTNFYSSSGKKGKMLHVVAFSGLQ